MQQNLQFSHLFAQIQHTFRADRVHFYGILQVRFQFERCSAMKNNFSFICELFDVFT